MTYFDISLRLALVSWWQQLSGKTYTYWYQIGAMINDYLSIEKPRGFLCSQVNIECSACACRAMNRE